MDTPPELHLLRQAMDAVNEKLVAVLHDRARLCRAIGICKRSHGLPAVDATREQQMLDGLLARAPADGFAREQLAAILHEVFAASRAVVERAGD